MTNLTLKDYSLRLLTSSSSKLLNFVNEGLFESGNFVFTACQCVSPPAPQQAAAVTSSVTASGDSAGGSGTSTVGTMENKPNGHVPADDMTSKDYYFDSYAHFGIHEVCFLFLNFFFLCFMN